MDVLIHRVPSCVPSPSVGKAEHDLCPLSHEATLAQFVYSSSHDFGIDVIMLRRSHEQVVCIQADPTYRGWVDGNLARLPSLREYRFPIIQISVFFDF